MNLNPHLATLVTIATLTVGSLTTTTLRAEGRDNSANGLVNPDQPDYPQIVSQPDDQMVQMDVATVKFTVLAVNGPLKYQWLRNGAALPDQTNSTLVIEKAGVKDVALYSCNLSKDMEIVPTRAASLMVYTNWLDEFGIDPAIIYATPQVSSGASGSCPGSYIGFVNYKKTVAQGWGWAPDTTNGNTVFTATDANRTNTKVDYLGKSGDAGCAQTTVTVPNVPTSTAYRFTIYFTNNVPTNSYGLTLDGFKP